MPCEQDSHIDHLLIEDLALLLAVHRMAYEHFSESIGFKHCDVNTTSGQLDSQLCHERRLARRRQARDPNGKSGLNSRRHSNGSPARDQSLTRVGLLALHGARLIPMLASFGIFQIVMTKRREIAIKFVNERHTSGNVQIDNLLI